MTAVDGYDDDRLVALYDEFNEGTHDTDFYARQLGTNPLRVADVGCGTGTFAIRLAREGHTVTGVDPAPRMLALARAKEGAERVAWLEGLAGDLPQGPFDAAVMTGHAFQCLLTDTEVLETLTAIRRRLVPGGRFLFETRNPVREAWRGWTTPDGPDAVASSAGPLSVRWTRSELEGDLLTLEGWTRFERDGFEVSDVSTLRFIAYEHLVDLVHRAGYGAVEVLGGWAGQPFDEATSEEIIVLARTSPGDPVILPV